MKPPRVRPKRGEVLEAFPPSEDDNPRQELVAPLSCRTYRPNDVQRRFHELPEPFRLAIGGLGMGKSLMGTYEGFLYSCHFNRGIPHIGLVGAPTYRMLKDVKIPMYRSMMPEECLQGGSWSLAYSASDMMLTLANGTLILFRSLDGQNYHRVRGVELTWFDLDEIRLLRTEEPWDVCAGRLRGPGVRRGGWGATTPNGEDWVVDRWMVNPREGYGYVHGTSHDNLTLEPEYLERLKATYSDLYYRQEVLGEIVTMAGAVYRPSREAWPDGNAYLCEADPKRETFAVVDFGRNNPRVLYVQRVPILQGRRQHWLDVIVGEWSEANGKPPADRLVPEMIDAIKGSGWRITKVYGDPAGDSRNEHTHESSAQQLRTALGVPFLVPQGPERLKAKGEEIVAGRICAADGTRSLVWASKGVAHPLGGYYLDAENVYRDHATLRYPDRRPGQAAPVESLKDGVHDHGTDAVRYYLVQVYGRQSLHPRDALGWSAVA